MLDVSTRECCYEYSHRETEMVITYSAVVVRRRCAGVSLESPALVALKHAMHTNGKIATVDIGYRRIVI